MKLAYSRRKSMNFLLIILLMQSIVCLTAFLDVPVARQVVGFVYLTFLPGFIVLKLLKLNEFDKIEAILYSVGFSIAFLMIICLFINELFLSLNFSRSLSLIPLITILNSFILISGIFLYLREKNIKILNEPIKLSIIVLMFLLPLILSIFGAICVDVYGNSLLLFMIIAISLLFIMIVLSVKLFPSRLYSLAVLTIGLSLLFHTSLISSYLYMGDIHIEYFILKTIGKNAMWSPIFMYPEDINYGRLNSMLSITVLPSIYSAILNLDTRWVLKILFPLIFSFLPLALYRLWQKNIGAKRAFIAVFFFMATNVFYFEMLGLNRQMIAELFFALLLLVILNNNIKPSAKIGSFIIFSFALITSHYSLAEIFLFLILSYFILSVVLKRSSRNVTATMVVLFLVLMFVWYIYTSSSAVFNSFINFGNYVISQLGDFFNPASRGTMVMRGLGLEAPPSIWNAASRTFSYLTEALIIVGFFGKVIRKTEIDFERNYFMLSVIAFVFLVSLILLPGLANTLNMTRFYHILLFFLAPFFVAGGEVIAKQVFKRREFESILLLIVLVPYFLFQTGFVYEVVKVESWSVPLSKYRMDNQILMCTFAYVNGWKASSAFWLNGHVNVQNARIYKDWSAHELVSYGMLPYAQFLSNTTVVPPSSIVYLSYLNVIDELIVTLDGRIFNSTELSFITNANLVYSNGGCQVYIVPDW